MGERSTGRRARVGRGRPRLRVALFPALFAAALAVSAGGVRAGDAPPVAEEHVQDALAQAGSNRKEIESFLEHARAAKDPRRLVAARFLVANMPGKGLVPMT